MELENHRFSSSVFVFQCKLKGEIICKGGMHETGCNLQQEPVLPVFVLFN